MKKFNKFKLLAPVFIVALFAPLFVNSSADALSGYTYISRDEYGKTHYACKQYIPTSYYGPLYKVKTVSFGYDSLSSSYGAQMDYYSNTGWNSKSTRNFSRLYGMIGNSMLVSAINSNDYYGKVSLGTTHKYNSHPMSYSKSFPMRYLANCQ